MRYYKLVDLFGDECHLEDIIETLSTRQHDEYWLLLTNDYYVSEKYLEDNGFVYGYLFGHRKYITV